jgi:hypothetical protein
MREGWTLARSIADRFGTNFLRIVGSVDADRIDLEQDVDD